MSFRRLLPHLAPGFLALALCTVPLAAAPELAGILAMPGNTRFRLVDRETETSSWLALQQTFGGYTLSSYDPKADVLVLTKDDTRLELRLGPIRVAASEAKPPIAVKGTVQLGANKFTIERATLVSGEENFLPLGNGFTLRLTPRVTSDGSFMLATNIDLTLAGGSKIILRDATVVTMLGHEFTIAIGAATPDEDDITIRLTPTVE